MSSRGEEDEREPKGERELTLVHTRLESHMLIWTGLLWGSELIKVCNHRPGDRERRRRSVSSVGSLLYLFLDLTAIPFVSSFTPRVI